MRTQALDIGVMILLYTCNVNKFTRKIESNGVFHYNNNIAKGAFMTPEDIDLRLLGCTDRLTKAMEKVGITNLLQLIMWLPLRYIDNSVETGLTGAATGSHVTVIGTMTQCEKRRAATGMDYIRMVIKDRKSGKDISAVIFRQGYLLNRLHSYLDGEVIISGFVKVDEQYGCSIASPEIISDNIKEGLRIIPVYRKIRGITEETLGAFIRMAFKILSDVSLIPEVDDAAKKSALFSFIDAAKMIHYPRKMEAIQEAKKRFLFNDLFYMAARFISLSRESKLDGICVSDTTFCDEMLKKLPYTLTPDQESTFLAIREDMINGRHFKALVQGDVSCGKTEVAFLSTFLAVGGGFQAAIMAPTQILAEQHYLKMVKRLEGTGIGVLLVTGKTKKAELKKLATGEVMIAIGTHALLSDKVVFKNIGLIVIDEEHRFGVAQRNALEAKASMIDCISMTATPIPRSLARAMLGDDVKVYSIKSMPGGRKKVLTYYDNGNRVIPFVKKILDAGNQCYAVCPMIDESESEKSPDDIMNVAKAAAIYRKHLGPDYVVEELTGETPASDQEDILSRFRDGKVHVLVSTTVVEVGVDVPNAALMVIHNAERFGLASMHQLRGRVGRGSVQSYCLLVSKSSPLENERIKTLCTTNDGFEIAEQDLLILRHSGNLFGTEQSGRNVYVSEMVRFERKYKETVDLARTLPMTTLQNFTNFMEWSELPKIHKEYDIAT